MINLIASIITFATLGLRLSPPPDSAPIFQAFASQAAAQLETMTLDEKIAQILLVRFPGDQEGISVQKRYQFGGYVFFSQDFAKKDVSAVQDLIFSLQSVSKIPLLTAVDEEGGIVTRVSQYPALSPKRFLSPKALYRAGGFDLIREDTLEKSRLLKTLGLNLNLAPVVDVSTNPSDFMFSRALGEDATLTAKFAETVISASHEVPAVSYTLKHFPGYGNNSDTHHAATTDQRSLASIMQYDLPPFRAGIDAGAEAILVSHNVIDAIDPDSPASLSPEIHDFLRHALGFTGVIIADDLAMGAVSKLPNLATRAVLAGNDLLITSDYLASIDELRSALASGTLSESTLDAHVLKILAWKYSKGLL